jgi:ubiquitin
MQAEVLETLVHAVEDGRLPYGRVEDALKRQRAAKERFLAGGGARGRAPSRAGRDVPLQALLGCDEHRRIADEMARFL